MLVLTRLGGWNFRSIKEENELNEIHAVERFPDGRIVGAPELHAEGAVVAE
jgi:hypothetical protein